MQESVSKICSSETFIAITYSVILQLLPLLRQRSLCPRQGEEILLSNPTMASVIWENLFKELKRWKENASRNFMSTLRR